MKAFLKRIKFFLEYAYWSVASRYFFVALFSVIFNYSFREQILRLCTVRWQKISGRLEVSGRKLSLRRLIHRVEKGLSMQPRRQVFALDFINEAVNALEDVYIYLDIDEAQWAFNVLNSYFTVVDSDDKKYVKACSKFLVLAAENSKTIPSGLNGYIPFRYGVAESEVLKSDIMGLMTRSKSVRWFQDTPVPDGIIDSAISAARLTPSSCNRQPYRYIVVNDPDRASEVAAISGGTGGWSHNIVCMITVVGDTSYVNAHHDRHSVYVDSALSIMPFILRLEEQGLSSCIINWVDIKVRDQKIRRLLQLHNNEVVVTSLAVGYADREGLVAYSQRKSLDNLRSRV